MDLNIIPQTDPCCQEYKQPESESIKTNLQRTKRMLETRLAKVNEGLAVLESNPELADNLQKLTSALRA